MQPTSLEKIVDSAKFIKSAIVATTIDDIEHLLAQLPIASKNLYDYPKDAPEEDWIEGKFHWVPIGLRRGNAGPIDLANQPMNPITERTINGMEALIELERQRELLKDSKIAEPESPRQAALRYFELPPLDQLPRLDKSEASSLIRTKAREIARRLKVRVLWNKETRKYVVSIEDEGIGQPPGLMHKTLLSLGETTKADKPYLIGVFGQGGSSTFSISEYSWVISRRAPDLLDGEPDGVGWTVIKRVCPVGRRDHYYAYLAAHPDGRVPSISAATADATLITHGTRFTHIGYDLASNGSEIIQNLYRMLNHSLYNPVLPFELITGPKEPVVINGNSYRLSSLGKTKRTKKPVLDKVFAYQPVAL